MEEASQDSVSYQEEEMKLEDLLEGDVVQGFGQRRQQQMRSKMTKAGHRALKREFWARSERIGKALMSLVNLLGMDAYKLPEVADAVDYEKDWENYTSPEADKITQAIEMVAENPPSKEEARAM